MLDEGIKPDVTDSSFDVIIFGYFSGLSIILKHHIRLQSLDKRHEH